ncbi:transcriptional regulator, AraC family [Oleidesulfovibrio alaskensis G20]|jgi:AraC-like DNA-binding protein|uniref:Transcriptional regulator, AraC family n=2 Tax=Oleidesulfovibrio alaskensis TaxID=58180 RepID=Q311I8_OLEA2|nr:transcriptional regulator, AraC family [Oleidesulfovibrio alaskensis G20]
MIQERVCSKVETTGFSNFSLTTFCQRTGRGRDISFSYVQQDGMLDVGFCVSGSWHVLLGGRKLSTGKGNVGMFHLPGDSWQSLYPPDTCIQGVGISVRIDALRSMFEDEPVTHEGLNRLLRGGADATVLEFGQMTAQEMEGVKQVLMAGSVDALRKLFLEAKTIELLHSFLVARNAQGRKPLTVAEIRKMASAVEIIAEDLEDPPCISGLASRLGMSASKLKSCFKEYTGDSVYSYIKKKRLENARRCIESGEMNVTEAAVSVGYSSLGHFSRIFKENFGVLPKDVSKGRYCLRHTAGM